MSISSRFAVGIHILSLINVDQGVTISSDYLAGSVNTNPVVIRRMMGMLKKAGLIEVRPGIAGIKLAKEPELITLFDVYKAVDVVQEKELFSIHENPHPDCTVGKHIQSTVEPLFIAAQLAMEKVLSNVTLLDVVEDIESKVALT
ncbi:DNA-binding transcriptional regulator, IscR family [Amphibacillus marinus]|uniref:DNA-binding transcriptional regulator, IscR family n=1 Tax=Amphibacillus marinus TaxID=872970 RepID=A0A1H8TBG0_9BACI|nr:Rrf2 family transcriptional regulator [Amphibacillus marinus]SEO88267.1 DNA-binding transcriptional regulator, IscR family [Amphibacillus marinus]